MLDSILIDSGYSDRGISPFLLVMSQIYGLCQVEAPIKNAFDNSHVYMFWKF